MTAHTFEYKLGPTLKQKVVMHPKYMELIRKPDDGTFVNFDEVTSFGIGVEKNNLMYMFVPLGLYFIGMLALMSQRKADFALPFLLLCGVLWFGMNMFHKARVKSAAQTESLDKLPKAQTMIVIGTTRTHSATGQSRGYLIKFHPKNPEAQKILQAMKNALPGKYVGVGFMKDMFAETGTSYVVRRAWTNSAGQYMESSRNSTAAARARY